MTKSSRRSKKRVGDVNIGRSARHRDTIADFFAERLLAHLDDPDSLYFFTLDESNPFRLTDVQKQAVLCRLEEMYSIGEISEQTFARSRPYLSCQQPPKP